jgi:hypothetical protein
MALMQWMVAIRAILIAQLWVQVIVGSLIVAPKSCHDACGKAGGTHGRESLGGCERAEEQMLGTLSLSSLVE